MTIISFINLMLKTTMRSTVGSFEGFDRISAATILQATGSLPPLYDQLLPIPDTVRTNVRLPELASSAIHTCF